MPVYGDEKSWGLFLSNYVVDAALLLRKETPI